MNQLHFNIDFLQPGKNLAVSKGVFSFLGKIKFPRLFVGKQLVRRVSTSVSFLVIFYMLLGVGCWYFYKQVYMTRESLLQANSKQIAELQQEVNELRAKIKKREERETAKRKRFEQLKSLKAGHVSWRGKLVGLRRSVLKKIWLTSFSVKDERRPVGVVVTGATVAGKGSDKPLRLVANFTNGLMANPVWYKNFSLKNWNIKTSKLAPGTEKAADKGDEELVEFTLQLESK